VSFLFREILVTLAFPRAIHRERTLSGQMSVALLGQRFVLTTSRFAPDATLIAVMRLDHCLGMMPGLLGERQLGAPRHDYPIGIIN
jgi:hypothetical protein